jgi:uncharacterized protein YabN with tetrapyrrole methylase and pyrophosphatase domain
MKASLTVVGTGIKAAGQLTPEARAWIEYADKVLHTVADPVTETWLRSINTNEESMTRFYEENKHRVITYHEIANYILDHVRDGLNVCAVFYGHPGIFVDASHQAISQAKKEGYYAQMLPGISSTDCLFADLNIDISRTGCQFLGATDFLIHDRFLDVSGAVIIWQIGIVGEFLYRSKGTNNKNLRILAESLQKFYPSEHQVIIYEAAQYSVSQPRIEYVSLSELGERNVTSISTLYIPPYVDKEVNSDIIVKLGMDSDSYKLISLGDTHVYKNC